MAPLLPADSTTAAVKGSNLSKRKYLESIIRDDSENIGSAAVTDNSTDVATGPAAAGSNGEP